MELELHGYPDVADKPDPPPKPFVVVRYRGDRALEAGVTQMARRGYVVQNQSTRKQAWSPWTGVFTDQQIHTVTFALASERKE